MVGKSISAIMFVGILVVAGWAQATSGVKPAVPVVKPAVPVVKPAVPVVKPAVPATGAKTVGKPALAPAPTLSPVKSPAAASPSSKNAAAKPVAPVGKHEATNTASPAKKPVARKTARSAPPKTEAKSQAAPAESSAGGSDSKRFSARGQRDPFHSVLQARSIGGSVCTTGKKCLMPEEVLLRGVVKTTSGFLAVVVNNQNKTYFLREEDPVFNGKVLRITADSVVFRQTSTDRAGRPHSTEVVKRIPGTKPVV